MKNNIWNVEESNLNIPKCKPIFHSNYCLFQVLTNIATVSIACSYNGTVFIIYKKLRY
jgi:hypothetical protein